MNGLKKGDKIIQELLLIDEIVYGVEPRYYYDDGVRRIYKFIDEYKNVYIWRTSKHVGLVLDEDTFLFASPGDNVVIKGTIKDISNYKGEDQIVLSRCRVERIMPNTSSDDELKKIKQELQLSKFNGVKEIKTLSYKEYKEEYDKYEPLVDSFVRTDNGCFIDVIIPEEVSQLYYYSE